MDCKVTILEENSVTGLGTVTFKITDPSGKPSPGLNKDPNKDGAIEYTYDLQPPSGDQWLKTPHPDTKIFWVLGELTGNVTVNVKVDGEFKPVTVGPITIPPRVNFFENTTTISGTLIKDSEQIKVEFTSDKNRNIQPNNRDPNFIVFYSGNTDKSVYSKKINNLDPFTFTISSKDDPLENHHEEYLDVFVLVTVEGTQVWYKVASEPVSKFL